MTYELFETLESEVRSELGLIDEPIITQAQLITAANDAIGKAERQILTLYEDYYRTSDTLRLVEGKSDYDMPENIHAAKLRGVIYVNGTDIYPVKRLQGPHLFQKLAELRAESGKYRYRYDIENPSSERGMRFVLYPAAAETGLYLKRSYIRRAERISSPGDVIDVPEGYAYVKAYVKHRAAQAEPGMHDMAALEKDINDELELLISTLAVKTPDEDNTIPMDTSWYDDHA